MRLNEEKDDLLLLFLIIDCLLFFGNAKKKTHENPTNEIIFSHKQKLKPKNTMNYLFIYRFNVIYKMKIKRQPQFIRVK